MKKNLSKLKKAKDLKHQSAALIIALLIVTVVGMIILAVGRDIVQSTYTTFRYSDSIIAGVLAQAGVEDGLAKIKNKIGLGPTGQDQGLWTHIPNRDPNDFSDFFDLYNDYLRFGPTISQLQIIRRNLSEFVGAAPGTSDEIAGVTTGPPNPTFVGLDYWSALIDSCRFDTGAGSYCTAAKWDATDKYYDLRVSSSDFGLSSSEFIDPTEPSDRIPVVNLDASDNVLKNQFYTISQQEGTEIWRFFDLSHFNGNTGDNNVQFLKFFYTAEGSGSATVDFYVHYDLANGLERHVPPQVPPTPEDGTGCYEPPYQIPGCTSSQGWCPGGGSHYKNYWRTSVSISAPATNNIKVWTPFSCWEAVNADYLVIRFSGITSSTYKLRFGIRLDSTGFFGDFIGTGVTKIKSVGIFGNARKTLEVWAYKMVHLDLSDNNFNTQIRCDNGNTNNLQECKIRLYRNIKY